MKLTRRHLLAFGGTAAVVAGGLAGFRLFSPDMEALPPAPVFAIDRIAIRGTDPIAYFEHRRPVAGDPALQAEWNGAIWRFASADNRDAFMAEPQRFAPQYGGFCAWAVAEKGELYSTQPENWSIVENRLFLNFNDDIQRRWQADVPGFIARADSRWPEIIRTA